LGLIGEYLGRIYADVRARPRYFVRQAVGETAGNDRGEAELAPVASHPGAIATGAGWGR
jgi:hypothetical protein